MKPALLVLDLINDLVHEDGSVGRDGFYAHARERGVLEHTAQAIAHCRATGVPVVYVVVGFTPGYPEWSARSTLFRHVKEKRQVLLGTWATEVHAALRPLPGEPVVVKNRIDPFYNTNLDTVLRAMEVDTLYVAGVSTEFVVLATAMSGHDRGYAVRVLDECVSSIDQHSHDCAMAVIEKVAAISGLEQLTMETVAA